MTPILGIWASGGPVGSYESIQTVSVTSATQATAEFTSIPSTYTHLQIRAIARHAGTGTSWGSFNCTFNSDTNTNYSYHILYGTGSLVSSTAGTTQASIPIGLAPASGATSGSFGACVVDILDYKNTNKYKTIRSTIGVDLNGTGDIRINSGLWRSTSAITSISIFQSNNFSQYSHFALYGIRTA